MPINPFPQENSDPELIPMECDLPSEDPFLVQSRIEEMQADLLSLELRALQIESDLKKAEKLFQKRRVALERLIAQDQAMYFGITPQTTVAVVHFYQSSGILLGDFNLQALQAGDYTVDPDSFEMIVNDDLAHGLKRIGHDLSMHVTFPDHS